MIRLTWDLPAEAKYVQLCRHLVRMTLRTVGVSDMRADELELAIGELCSNVVRHARLAPQSSYVVEFEINDLSAYITVTDNGVGFQPDIASEPTPTDSGGLGLWLVSQLTDKLEFNQIEGSGVTVRAEKRLDGTNSSR
jgi:serine/threonine-protein kinase RsbW